LKNPFFCEWSFLVNYFCFVGISGMEIQKERRRSRLELGVFRELNFARIKEKDISSLN